MVKVCVFACASPLPSTSVGTHKHGHKRTPTVANKFSLPCFSCWEKIWQQLLHRHVSWPPLQTITYKYVVIPVFNSLLWTKMHSSLFSVQSCLRSWPFCPYPISWCIFSKPTELCSCVAQTEVFLCCWYMWVKEESFENRKIGILPSTKWKWFTKLELFS